MRVFLIQHLYTASIHTNIHTNMGTEGMTVRLQASNSLQTYKKKKRKAKEEKKRNKTGINMAFQNPQPCFKAKEEKHAYRSLGMASVSERIYCLFYIFKSYFHLGCNELMLHDRWGNGMCRRRNKCFTENLKSLNCRNIS